MPLFKTFGNKEPQQAPQTMQIDPNDPYAVEKAGAVIYAVKPILQAELRRKNPDAYDTLLNRKVQLGSEIKSMYDKFSKGEMTVNEWNDYFKKQSAVSNKLVEDSDLPESLDPGDIQRLLGPQVYKEYVQALSISRNHASKKGFEQSGIVGNIEKPLTIDDIRFGKRMSFASITQGPTYGGKNQEYQGSWMYDPANGQYSLDPKLSYNVDMKTGQPIKQ
jgi:hypothetical protein